MDNQTSSQENHKFIKHKRTSCYKFAKMPNKVGCMVESIDFSEDKSQDSVSTSSLNDATVRPLSFHAQSNSHVRGNIFFL